MNEGEANERNATQLKLYTFGGQMEKVGKAGIGERKEKRQNNQNQRQIRTFYDDDDSWHRLRFERQEL